MIKFSINFQSNRNQTEPKPKKIGKKRGAKSEKKTKPKRKKPSQTKKTEPSWFEPVFFLKTKQNRNRSV